MQYRTRRNYTDGAFLGPRVGDKIFVTLLILTLYLGIGNDFATSNIINIAAVLFMWWVALEFSVINPCWNPVQQTSRSYTYSTLSS